MRRALAALTLASILVGLAGDPVDAAKEKDKKKNKATTTTVAPGPIFQRTGSGTATTEVFKVPRNWDLAWTYDCENFPAPSGLFQVFVYKSDGDLDFRNALVNQLGSSGKGVEHYHSGGSKYLTVNSVCDWTVTVTKA